MSLFNDHNIRIQRPQETTHIPNKTEENVITTPKNRTNATQK